MKYFAYGSNLLESEIKRTASGAEDLGRAYLTGYRLVFDKHSISRRGDAANIIDNPASEVWGWVYIVSEQDQSRLRGREKGYLELELFVHLMPKDHSIPKLIEAFTFIGERACRLGCGPTRSYLNLVISGAEARHLPADYVGLLKSIRLTRQTNRLSEF